MSRPKVLVTGGAGYIGSHACKALSEVGFLPVAYDDLSGGHEDAVRWGPLEVGNLLDRDRLETLFTDHDFAGVMHFAAFISVGESVADPEKYVRNNVGGTSALLDALAKRPLPLIFSSTAAVYGIPQEMPITEGAALEPINPYGETKLASERAIAAASSERGFGHAILRYFNACGADRDGEIGENHDPETHLIPLALKAAAGQGALTLFGTDYPTPDGTCIRDYIHVTDLAEAHVAALNHLLKGGSYLTANLGTGSGVSIREVLDAVRIVTGRDVPLTVGERREGDPPILVADPARAQRELGWSARYSDIETIVETAWRWHNRR